MECFCKTNGCNWECTDDQGNRSTRHQFNSCVFGPDNSLGLAEAVKYLKSHCGVDSVVELRDHDTGIYHLRIATFPTTCASQLCYHLSLEGIA